MTERSDREHALRELLGELSAAITAISLYGGSHPRSGEAITRLSRRLEALLSRVDEKLAIVAIGDELFVDGRPFTRLSRHAPSLVRRFARVEIEHLSFLPGVQEAELRQFLGELAAGDDEPVRSRPHVLVGKVAVGAPGAGVGLDLRASERGRLPSLRDRVALVHETFAALGQGRGLVVANLDLVARDILARLEATPAPLALLAPWEGVERWNAVHAHNVCVIAEALAMLAGVPQAACFDLGVASLLHDVGKVFDPPEQLARELDLGSTEVELILEHPKAGLEAVLAAQQLPPLTLIVTFEHHLAYNGTGYPQLARPRRPHPAARVVAVADTFDALYTARASRGGMRTEDVLSWIALREGTILDPDWGHALRTLVAIST
jgi:HD-GYP domain-containing protein (c-di-GMP phosphodiesterase class II)